MNLELLMLGDQPVAQLVERARFAEASGFDAVWVADERFYREAYSVLTQVASATERIRLGPCVTDPFARHPALTAMAIATLDEISAGRAALGLGAGVSGFAELGIHPHRPPRAIREAISLIRALLRGEQVDFTGEVISFRDGRLSFAPLRPEIPICVASNGPLGQRVAGSVADGAIMEACGSVPEALAFRAEVERGEASAGRKPHTVRIVARLNACIASDGGRARDVVRPSVARYLGRGSLRLATAAMQGLILPPEVTAPMANAPYAEGVKPYLPLLPLISDRHVDALTLGGAARKSRRMLRGCPRQASMHLSSGRSLGMVYPQRTRSRRSALSCRVSLAPCGHSSPYKPSWSAVETNDQAMDRRCATQARSEGACVDPIIVTWRLERSANGRTSFPRR